jgi:hypothetical protein
MAITSKTILVAKGSGALETLIAAAIAAGKQPVGGVVVAGELFYQAVQEGTDIGTFEDVEARVTTAEAAIDAVELLATTTSHAANGAIPVTATGAETHYITKAGIALMTMAAPAAAGIVRRIVNTTDNAHTLTTVALLDDGVVGGAKNVATFAAFAGSSITVVSTPGLTWAVLSLNAVTVA